MVKYSGAAQATVRLREERDMLVFEIEDDGTGFDLLRLATEQACRAWPAGSLLSAVS